MANKSFTVGYMPDSKGYMKDSKPYIRFSGAWITDELGINIGDKLQLIPGRNMIVLMKVPRSD